MKKKILISFGTRPEALKLVKLIYFLKKEKTLNVKICVSGQHQQMLKQVLKLFGIEPDFNLKVMKSNQSLNLLASKILEKFNKVLLDFKPDLILVHGDTTTAYISSLAAFQNKIKIGHVEAGLRTHNLEYPYPEEFNRKSIATIADINFTPTNIATKNLLNENVNKKKIFQTGNTIVDTLEFSLGILNRNKKILNNVKKNFSFLDNEKKLIIVTSHRRENYGNGIENICDALKKIVSKNKDIQIIYSVHLNPKVSTIIKKKLNNIKDIFLVKPQDYFTFIYLMKISYLILTDSGGIQEEAPTFKTPVLVLRNETERPEAKNFGGSILVGTDKDNIANTVSRLINNHKLYKKMSYIKNPYGDGKSINKIIRHLKKYLSK